MVLKNFLRHDGCDICIYKCDQPIIISVCGQTFRGHKDCMHEKMNEIIKESKKKI
jgi:hypothetical protein